jgi:hypothetical protein
LICTLQNVGCDLIAPGRHDAWQTPSLANIWKIAHAGEEQVALTGSFEACTPPVLFYFAMT